jgi:benzodiazapine receptor
MHTQIQQRSLLEHPWRIAALVAVVFNVAYNYLSEWLGDHARNVAQVSSDYQSLFTPASYAFAIWGVIYASTLVYAVAALLPNQLDVRMHDRVAPWLVLTNALATLWISLFTAEHLGPSVLIILAMLTATGFMYAIANEHLASEKLSRWWRVPFALWVTWLSVATIANISLALVATGWDGWPLSAPIWATIMLGVAALVALGLNIVYRDPVVPLVLAWASAAIAVARWEDSTLVAVVGMLVALKALLWSGSTLLFEAYPIPKKYIDAGRRALRVRPEDLRRT